jgi:hypothetical protein
MEETEAEARLGKAARTPRPLRAMASLVVYVAIFLLVFSYLGALVIDRLSTIHVPAGQVAALSDDPLAGQGVRARLEPDHVTDVWVGMKGRILFNMDGQQQNMPAVVRRLDYTGPDTNPAILLTLAPLTAEDAALLRRGMPVRVDLNRQLLRRALGMSVGGGP